MKRLAIFVEGQTEQIFVQKLLEEIAGKRNIHIEIKARDPRQSGRFIVSLRLNSQLIEYYILIYNSCNDERLVSDICDQYINLVANGYSKIIGLRDVYPMSINEVSTLEERLNIGLPRGEIPVHLVLAVMEIEAWFLSEWKHFLKVDSSLTPNKIYNELGFNPKIDDMETRPHPAEDLNQIYQLVGRSYKKRKGQAETIVSNLDYEFLYLNLVNKVPHFGEFIRQIHIFMDSSS